MMRRLGDSPNFEHGDAPGALDAFVLVMAASRAHERPPFLFQLPDDVAYLGHDGYSASACSNNRRATAGSAWPLVRPMTWPKRACSAADLPAR